MIVVIFTKSRICEYTHTKTCGLSWAANTHVHSHLPLPLPKTFTLHICLKQDIWNFYSGGLTLFAWRNTLIFHEHNSHQGKQYTRTLTGTDCTHACFTAQAIEQHTVCLQNFSLSGQLLSITELTQAILDPNHANWSNEMEGQVDWDKTNTANTADDGEQAVAGSSDVVLGVEWAWPEC